MMHAYCQILITHAVHPGHTHWQGNGTVDVGGRENTRQRMRAISCDRLDFKGEGEQAAADVIDWQSID